MSFGTFTCAHCGGVFEKARSDEEALSEAAALLSTSEMNLEQAIVCDECFAEFSKWLKQHPEARIN